MKGEQQSVLALRHVAVFNKGAYWEMNNSFTEEEFQETKTERVKKNP